MVYSIVRECQYVWDGEFGRVRCGRRASSYSRLLVGNKRQRTFRCDEHTGYGNDTVLRMQYSRFIDPTETFGLGYTP